MDPHWFGSRDRIRIRIEIKSCIQIRMKTNADPQHCFRHMFFVYTINEKAQSYNFSSFQSYFTRLVRHSSTQMYRTEPPSLQAIKESYSNSEDEFHPAYRLARLTQNHSIIC